jgi:hypothetical protein
MFKVLHFRLPYVVNVCIVLLYVITYLQCVEFLGCIYYGVSGVRLFNVLCYVELGEEGRGG